MHAALSKILLLKSSFFIFSLYFESRPLLQTVNKLLRGTGQIDKLCLKEPKVSRKYLFLVQHNFLATKNVAATQNHPTTKILVAVKNVALATTENSSTTKNVAHSDLFLVNNSPNTTNDKNIQPSSLRTSG